VSRRGIEQETQCGAPPKEARLWRRPVEHRHPQRTEGQTDAREEQ